MPRPIPSPAQLQSYNVNRPGQVEGIRQSLYDFQVYPALGNSIMTFFQVPLGQGTPAKTYEDTNMESAGQLPTPKMFLVEQISCFFFPGLPIVSAAFAQQLNDLQQFVESGYLEFFIGSKPYLDEAPLLRFPQPNWIFGFAASFDADVAYGAASGKPYAMEPPILLIPNQNFKVTLNWPNGLQPVSVAARVGVVMNGILYRNSQ